MKKLMTKKDAGFMLKDQINESMLRVNAAKFGHSIEEIAPQYTNSYYLPDKSQYAPEKQVCKGAKKNPGRSYSLVQDGIAPGLPARASNNGSRFEENSRSYNGGLSFPKHSRNNNAQEMSQRMNMAKQA